MIFRGWQVWTLGPPGQFEVNPSMSCRCSPSWCHLLKMKNQRSWLVFGLWCFSWLKSSTKWGPVGGQMLRAKHKACLYHWLIMQTFSIRVFMWIYAQSKRFISVFSFDNFAIQRHATIILPEYHYRSSRPSMWQWGRRFNSAQAAAVLVSELPRLLLDPR